MSKRVLIPVGIVAVVLIVLLIVLLASGGSDGDEPATPVAGAVSAKDLTVGTCISDANSTTGDVTTFDAVSCNKPHDGEVFTIIELEGEKYPGTKFVTGKGQRGCRARLRRQATRKAFRDRLLGYKFVYPTSQSWAQGDREVTCLATFRKPRTKKLAQRAKS
ncbi:MAG TPA: septum formation family protein [Solirubrobacteraceae bacterium]|nr:septum formation family protein [Solirubrobacteraceae bacterium]